MASRDIGALGPKEGPPVDFHWNPAWNLLALAPWIVLVPLLLLRPNRRLRAWAVLLPLAAVVGLAALLLAAGVMNDYLFIGVMYFELSLAVAWLISPYLIRMGRLAVLPLVFLMLGVGIAGMLANFALPFDIDAFPVLMGSCFAFGVALGVATLGLVVAGLVCRKTYRPGRFVVAYGFAMALVGCLFSLPLVVLFTVGSIFSGAGLQILGVVGIYVGFGLLGGLGLYVLILPFITLTAFNSVYRERFQALSGFVRTEMECAPPTVSEGHLDGPS